MHTTVRKEKGENASTAEYVVRTKKNLWCQEYFFMLRCHITTWIKELVVWSPKHNNPGFLLRPRVRESEKKIEFQILTRLSQFPLTKLISFILKWCNWKDIFDLGNGTGIILFPLIRISWHDTWWKNWLPGAWHNCYMFSVLTYNEFLSPNSRRFSLWMSLIFFYEHSFTFRLSEKRVLYSKLLLLKLL